MRRALRLACTGLGRSSPNPSVAALLVRDDQCLGSGVHVRCGAGHAEVLALADARAHGQELRGATMYVTLAPCTRHGRTPPCSEALIAAGLSRVVVALEDPHQDDAAAILEGAGIDYSSGCCGDVAQQLHGGFLKRAAHGLPRITGKWAMTVDGYLAAASGHSQWISSTTARDLSRRRRRVFDAIVVGAGTLRADNPRLLSGQQRSPRRVIVAREQIPDFTAARVCAGSAPVLCFHADSDVERQDAARSCGVELQQWQPVQGIAAVFRRLAALGCNDVLVEGGSGIHHASLEAELYDRLEVYIAARSLGGGLAVAGRRGVERVELGSRWHLEVSPMQLGDSICLRYRRAVD